MRTLILAACFLASCGERDPEIAAEPPAEPSTDHAVGVAPAAPGPLPAYAGVWASDASLCDLTPGGAVPGPIAFTATEFVGYENRCRIGESVERPQGEFHLQLYCESEGVQYEEALVAHLDGDSLRLSRGDGSQTTFVRCGEPQ